MAREENTTVVTACANCPLGGRTGLLAHVPGRTNLIQKFKRGEFTLDRGVSMFEEGESHRGLYTLLDGALMRYRPAPEGTRQIVNIMFPGDLIGIQGLHDEPFQHVVEALMPVRLCRFDSRDLDALIGSDPGLGHDLVWMAAKEESALESHLVALGKRRATKRIAYLASFILDRSFETGLSPSPSAVQLPITQAQIADMLGLSHVHCNRSIQQLRAEGLVRWDQSGLATDNLELLRDHADYVRPFRSPRPYL